MNVEICWGCRAKILFAAIVAIGMFLALLPARVREPVEAEGNA